MRAGIVLVGLLGIKTGDVLADTFQESNIINDQPVNFESDVNLSSRINIIPGSGIPRQSPWENDKNEIGLTGNSQFLFYLPFVSAEYCFSGYYDDFSDPNSGWPNIDDADRLLEYNNEEYRILVKNINIWGGASPGFQAVDYLVTVNVRNESGAYGSYGIIFQLEEDWSTFYTFEIIPDGYFTIWRFNSKKSGWKLLAYEFSPYINQSTASNEIQVARTGALIQGFTNGHLIIEIEDASYTGVGSVGLISTAYDRENVDARFDNFAVNPLDCSVPGSTTLKFAQSFPEQDVWANRYLNTDSGKIIR
jgi:hypothetical protein